MTKTGCREEKSIQPGGKIAGTFERCGRVVAMRNAGIETNVRDSKTTKLTPATACGYVFVLCSGSRMYKGKNERKQGPTSGSNAKCEGVLLPSDV